jgi:hypothetical protein
MDYINNKGEHIGLLTTAISNEKSITISRLHDVATITVRDRTKGKASPKTSFGDSPYGK